MDLKLKKCNGNLKSAPLTRYFVVLFFSATPATSLLGFVVCLYQKLLPVNQYSPILAKQLKLRQSRSKLFLNLNSDFQPILPQTLSCIRVWNRAGPF